MERLSLKNSKIIELEEKNEEEFNKALQDFWKAIEEQGTPLIEKIDGENDLATFVFRGDEDYENVVFLPPVGKGNFKENRMKRLRDSNLWYITYKVRNDIRFSYSFSPNDTFDDDWEKRVDRLVHDKFNQNISVFEGAKKDEVFISNVSMSNDAEDFWVKKRPHISRGKVEEHQFKSERLEGDRRVRIYTPYGYSEKNKDYGFLILTDGDDYINRLSAVNVLDNLIGDRKIPPIVAIFIDSTETRRKDLKCSDIFADILVEELIPWVREGYNISNRAEKAIIGGLSLGGLTATYIGLKHSEVFGNVLSQSGSHWYAPEGEEVEGNNCWMSTQYEKVDKLPLKFYINVGILETKDRMIHTNINLKDVLKSKGYAVNFEEFKSGHDYLCWGETLASGLISLIGIE